MGVSAILGQFLLSILLSFALILLGVLNSIRPFIGFLGKYMIGRIASRLSIAMYLSDTKHINILATTKLDGYLNRLQFIERVKSNLLEARHPSGELIYPEFQERVKVWWGFLFFVPNPKFLLENHIVEKEISMQDFESERMRLYLENWKENESYWQYFLVHIRETGKTTILCKFSHVLGDGASLVQLLHKIADPRTANNPPPTKPPGPHYGWKLLMILPLVPVIGIWQLTRVVILSNISSLVEINGKPKKSELTDSAAAGNKEIFLTAVRFSLPDVKLIAHNTRTSVNAVLATMLAFSLKEYFRRKGFADEQMLPRVPLLFPTHSKHKENGLENSFGVAVIPLKMHLEGVKEQLQTNHESLEQLKSPFSFPLQVMFSVFRWLIGGLPMSWQPEFPVPLGLSIFVTPKLTLKLLGSGIEDSSYAATASRVHPFLLTWMTFGDNATLSIAALENDRVFCTESDLRELRQIIIEKMQLLQKSTGVLSRCLDSMC